MDTILNQIIDKGPKNEFDKYKNKMLRRPIHILAGYNNWSNSTITKSYQELTEKELPIYYIDDFFGKDMICMYCNLYKTYDNSIKRAENQDYIRKVNETKEGIFLFLVQPPFNYQKLKLDKGETYIDKFEIVKRYSDGIDFKLKVSNGQEYKLFLNKRSANCIRLNANEKTIIDKPSA